MAFSTKQKRKQPSAGTNLSDVFLKSALKRTGKSIETWYKALDNFNGRKYEHSVLVSHMMQAYNIAQWEADAIAYSYSAAKGSSSQQKPRRRHRSSKRNKKNKNTNEN